MSLGSIASRHFFESEPCMAVKACKMLRDLGPYIQKAGLSSKDINMPWTRIIKGAATCEIGRRDGSVKPIDPDYKLPCNLVYAVLDAITEFPADNDDRIYEALSNALIRRTVFITGAINMDGCPVSDRGEVVFIGRSNVGKSSLVNMVSLCFLFMITRIWFGSFSDKNYDLHDVCLTLIDYKSKITCIH